MEDFITTASPPTKFARLFILLWLFALAISVGFQHRHRLRAITKPGTNYRASLDALACSLKQVVSEYPSRR